MKEYIHYGHDHFYEHLFVPIKNQGIPWVKPDPYTGMWGSPLNSTNGWKDWCECNDFHRDRLDKSFIFTLKENSKVLYIRNEFDLEDIRIKGYLDDRVKFADSYHLDKWYRIDFERLLNEFKYDAIDVQVNTWEVYDGLYGWDCDSILILNPDCVDEIIKRKRAEKICQKLKELMAMMRSAI